MENINLAEAAYNAYRSASGLCEPLSGWELPEWANLGGAAKLSWAAAASAAVLAEAEGFRLVHPFKTAASLSFAEPEAAFEVAPEDEGREEEE